jgi:hypothetical protein
LGYCAIVGLARELARAPDMSREAGRHLCKLHGLECGVFNKSIIWPAAPLAIGLPRHGKGGCPKGTRHAMFASPALATESTGARMSLFKHCLMPSGRVRRRLEQGDPKIVALTGDVTSLKSTVARLDGLMTALDRAVPRRQALGPFAGGDSVDAIADECKAAINRTRQPRLLRQRLR